MKIPLETKSKLLVERVAAFPIYTCELKKVPKDDVVPPGYEGRIIVPGGCGKYWGYEPGEYMKTLGGIDHISSILTPRDILWVPLYRGEQGKPERWPPAKLPDFDAHLELIREVGPRLRGVLTGNQGPELSYRMAGFTPQRNIKTIVRFMRMAGKVLREAGARPVYGPMDREIAQDCYCANVMMLTELHHQRAVAFCFCGFTLWPGVYFDRNNKELSHSRRYIMSLQHGRPLSVMQDYLSRGQFWTDIHEEGGLEYRNDYLLAEAGFSAGIY